MDAGRLAVDLALLLAAAKTGGWAATRVGQPAVVGELLAGVALGAGLLGPAVGLPPIDAQAGPAAGDAAALRAFAAVGAILLLFEVGLGSRASDLRRVGRSSLLVALIGIVASFVAGFAFSLGLAQIWPAWRAADVALPPYLLHVFLGAALTATSVGITARVLDDMGRVRTPEARIILGAAVLDDVGGLLLLGAVAALVSVALQGTSPSAFEWGATMAWPVLFVAAVLVAATLLMPRLSPWIAARARAGAKVSVTLALAFALMMAWLAAMAGLAEIVGAFAAGLLLAETPLAARVAQGLKVLASVFVGLFFVTLGMRVDLAGLEGQVVPALVIGLALAAVAVGAKLACGLGVVGHQARRLPVAVGMVPRGEVGLVFASMGLAFGLLAAWQYALLVLVVLLTTALTPLWLARLRDRFSPSEHSQPAMVHASPALEP